MALMVRFAGLKPLPGAWPVLAAWGGKVRP